MKLKLKTLPVLIFLTYLIITFVMYIFSPLGWEKQNIFMMIIFNISIWVALYYGFMMAINKQTSRVVPAIRKNNDKISYFFSIITIIVLYLNLQVIFQKSNIGLGDFFTSQANFTLGDAYFNRNDEGFSFSGVKSLFYMIGIPISYTYIYGNIFKWRQIKLYHKIITTLYVLIHILAYVSIGTNKGIFDFILAIPIIFLASKGSITTIYRVPKKYILLVLGICWMAFSFFGASISSRNQGRILTYNTINGATIDYNAMIFKVLPDRYHSAYVSLDFYLTHAYNNMDKAMDLPFKPCYGLGNSPVLLQQVQKLGIGSQIPSRTYESRLSDYYGVPNGLWWYTAYVAFANDVSFFGVPIVVMLLAYLLGCLWRDVLDNKNIKAVPLLYLMIICFFYLNANNQVFGKGQLIPFCILFFVWYFSKRKIVL